MVDAYRLLSKVLDSTEDVALSLCEEQYIQNFGLPEILTKEQCLAKTTHDALRVMYNRLSCVDKQKNVSSWMVV